MNLTNEKNKKLIFFAAPIFISINSDLRLPLDKIIYFEDIVIRFNGVHKIVYRRKTRYFIDAYVCKGKIKLPAKINLQMSHCYSSLYFFPKYFLSSVPSVKMFSLLIIPIVPVNNKIVVSVAR